MSLQFVADKILDYELAQSITGIMPNQVLRYIPENQSERLIWQKALERDTEAFSLKYPQSLKRSIEEFVAHSQTLTFPDDGATPYRTKLAIKIHKDAECWNPFPKLSGITNKSKDQRRKDSAFICFLFMMIFHPETSEIFAGRYYEVFSIAIPKSLKAKQELQSVWRVRYEEDRSFIIECFSKIVAETHLFLLAMELIASGSYLQKTISNRYQFILELLNGFPWYIHGKSGIAIQDVLQQEIQVDFASMESNGKRPPRYHPIVDQFSGCLSGYLDIFRRASIDYLPSKNHPAEILRDLIASGSTWGSSKRIYSEGDWGRMIIEKKRNASVLLFKSIKRLSILKKRELNAGAFSQSFSISNKRREALLILFSGLSRDPEICYLSRLMLYRDSLPLFQNLVIRPKRS